MQFQYALRSGALVQAVYILGHDGQAGDPCLQIHQRPMARVGPRRPDAVASVLIPAPDAFRVPGKCLGCGQVFGSEPGPQPGLCVPEGGYTALRGHA